MNEVLKACGGRCITGLVVDQEGALFSGTACTPELVRALGATVGGETDLCGIAAADTAVMDGNAKSQDLFLAARENK